MVKRPLGLGPSLYRASVVGDKMEEQLKRTEARCVRSVRLGGYHRQPSTHVTATRPPQGPAPNELGRPAAHLR